MRPGHASLHLLATTIEGFGMLTRMFRISKHRRAALSGAGWLTAGLAILLVPGLRSGETNKGTPNWVAGGLFLTFGVVLLVHALRASRRQAAESPAARDPDVA